MNKILPKVLLTLIMLLSFFCITQNCRVFAAEDVTDDTNVKQFVNGTQLKIEGPADDTTSGLRGIIGKLLGFLRIASGLVAILMIAITGFNYIVGGAEVKKEMKEKMFPIILGLLIVFGAITITTFVMGVL